LAFYFPHLHLKIFVMLTVKGGGEVRSEQGSAGGNYLWN
jgi:hypothetical protein